MIDACSLVCASGVLSRTCHRITDEHTKIWEADGPHRREERCHCDILDPQIRYKVFLSLSLLLLFFPCNLFRNSFFFFGHSFLISGPKLFSARNCLHHVRFKSEAGDTILRITYERYLYFVRSRLPRLLLPFRLLTWHRSFST